MGYDEYDSEDLDLFDDLESEDELDLEISQTLRRKSTRRNRKNKKTATADRSERRKRDRKTEAFADDDTMLTQEGSELDVTESFFKGEEKPSVDAFSATASASDALAESELPDMAEMADLLDVPEMSEVTDMSDFPEISEDLFGGEELTENHSLEDADVPEAESEDDMADLAMMLNGDFADELTGEPDSGEKDSREEGLLEDDKKASSSKEKEKMDGEDFDLDMVSSGESGDLDDLLSMMEGDAAGDFPLADFPDEEHEQPAGEDGLSDILSLDSLMGEKPSSEPEQQSSIGDLSDVFADSLSAVSSDVSEEDKELEEAVMNMVPEGAKKKKPGIFAKLFGNIIDDKSKEQFKKEQEEAKKAEFKKSEKERIKRGDLTEEEQRKKDEKEAAIAQTKEEKKAAKEAKKAAAAQKKAEKIEKKKQMAAAKAEAETLEVDEGRINRVGAGIVFGFFAVVAVFILIGTNQFSYASSIKQAKNYFEVKKYTKAYEEVAGLTIKEDDEEMYSKILTVMFVNKELNSYNNYYGIHQYDKALDSLLKGLKRYDKYLETARELGVKSDLDYVRSQIIAELENTYGISEKTALAMNQMEDRDQYSASVIQASLDAVQSVE